MYATLDSASSLSGGNMKGASAQPAQAQPAEQPDPRPAPFRTLQGPLGTMRLGITGLGAPRCASADPFARPRARAPLAARPATRPQVRLGGGGGAGATEAAEAVGAGSLGDRTSNPAETLVPEAVFGDTILPQLGSAPLSRAARGLSRGSRRSPPGRVRERPKSVS